MSASRQTKIKLTYDGVDISPDVNKSLIDLTFTDNAGGKSDDLQITLEDRENLWSGDWHPSKGARLELTIQPFDSPELPCGSFEIDEITNSGKPTVVTIKALSVPVSSPLRMEKHTRTWEGADLQVIASDIASNAGVELAWFGGDLPKYNRMDQRDESDLAFLNRLAKENNHKVKVADRQIIIWDEQQYSRQAPVQIISPLLEGRVKTFSFTNRTQDIYAACRVQYHDPDEKIDIEYTARTEQSVGTDRVLEIRRRVENVNQARTLAEKELAEANRLEVTGNMTLLGDSELTSGLVFTVTGYGVYDGNYLIDKAVHRVGEQSGYEVTIEFHSVEGS